MGLYLSFALFALVVIGYEVAGKKLLSRREARLILTNASTFAPKNEKNDKPDEKQPK